MRNPGFPQGNDYMMQQPKKSVSYATLIVVVLCTLILAFVLFRNFDRIGSLFSSAIQSNTGLQLNQHVLLSGNLFANGDLVSYTHTLQTADHGVVGIKSRSLDMTQYTGFVEIQWTVEKQLNDIFIVEVSAISWSLVDTWMVAVATGQSLWSGSGIYIAQAGIYLPAEFGTKYVIQDQSVHGELTVKNIANNQVVTIGYFPCNSSDPNKNCMELQKNISATAEKTFTTPNGDVLYKLEWVTSWFFTNGKLYWYFINDVPEQDVTDLASAIILPNSDYVKNTLLSKLQTLCTDGTTSLMQVTTSNLGVDTNGLVVTMDGPTANGQAKCKVVVDPSQAAGGAKISYNAITQSTGDTVSPSTTTTTSTSPAITSLDTSVKQFPVSLDKTLTFSSSRGYSVTFPSKNLSYDSVAVDEDLWLAGVRCSTQLNVTKFSDEATLDDSPAVKIFVCTIKWTLSNLWNSIIQKTTGSGMNFLIQILDPAWFDFANNIVIE